VSTSVSRENDFDYSFNIIIPTTKKDA
jgi:hypothetical protein